MFNNRNVFWYFLGRSFYSFVVVLVSFVLARVLTIKNYGFFQQFLLLGRIFIPIVSGILSHFIFFRFVKESNPEKFKSNIIIISHFIGLISAVFSIVLGWGVLGKHPHFFKEEILLFVYVFLVSSVSFYEHLCISAGKYLKATFYLFSVSLVMLFTVIFAAMYNGSILAVLNALILYAVLRYLWVFLDMHVYLDKGRIAEAFYYIFSQKAFLIPLVGTYVVGIFSSSVHKLIVSFFKVPEDFSIYINGVMLIPIITVAVNNITNALLPRFSFYLKDDKQSFLESWHRKIVLIATLLYPAIFLMMFFSQEIINVAFSDTYSGSVIFFKIALFVLFLRVTSYGSILSIMGETKVLFYISLIDMLLGIMFGIAGFYLWDTRGVILSYVVVTYIQVMLFLIYISRSINVKFKSIFPFGTLFKIAIFSIILNFIVYLIVNNIFDSPTIKLAVAGVTVMLLAAIKYIREKDAYIGVVLLFFIFLIIINVKEPVIVAHKGIDTLPLGEKSILLAESKGIKFIESDLHVLKDSSIVFSHDPILDKYGYVPATYRKANDIYIKDKGVKLARLDPVLKKIENSRMFLELKSYSTDMIKNEEGIKLDSLLPLIINQKVSIYRDKIEYIISFDPFVLERIREDVLRGFLVGDRTIDVVSNKFGILRSVTPYLIVVLAKIKKFDGVFVYKDIYSPRLYAFSKFMGMDFYVWTVKDGEFYRCDGMIKSISLN